MDDSFLSEKTIAKSMTLEILTSSVKLPPIPTNGTRLLELVQSPMDDIDIPDFAKLVEGDPGLLTSVLKLANSPYYGEIDKISSLKSAITRIGLTETIHSVCLYLFKGILPKFPAVKGFSSLEYWTFSWGCAQANRRLGHPNLGLDIIPGQLYLAGLLHGIGKIMMAIHYPHEFSRCLDMADKLQQPLAKIEKDIFGTTDAFVAANILDAWSLPEPVCNAVLYINMPEKAPETCQDIAALTQLSYFITRLAELGKSGDGDDVDVNSAFICDLKKSRLSDPSIRDQVIEEIIQSIKSKSSIISGEPVKQKPRRINTTQRSPQPKTAPPLKKKKGIFATILSWFSR